MKNEGSRGLRRGIGGPPPPAWSKRPVTSLGNITYLFYFKKQSPDPTPSQRGPLTSSRAGPGSSQAGQSGGSNAHARLVGSAPLHARLPPLCSRCKDSARFLGPRHCQVQGEARAGARGHAGPPAAREGQSARPRPGRQVAVRVGRVSEEMTCTKNSVFRFPAQPGIRSKMNRMARPSGPQGGLSLCPGRRGRGDPPLPTLLSLRVGIIPIATLRDGVGLGGGCATTEPIGLRPLPLAFPVPPAGQGAQGVRTHSGSQGGTDPVSGPARWFCRPGRKWAVERVEAWPRAARCHRGDGECAPCASLNCPPGHRPAPPQHQGSREALPRQRLSLRCHALWMRLRASSNFLLEASWMALWGSSTCAGRQGA